MPARIVVVYDEAEFVQKLAARIRAEGHEVAAFPDPIEAWDALEAAQRTEVLVTRITFPLGRSNGMALARMAVSKRREIKTIILSRPEYVEEFRDEDMRVLSNALPNEVAAEVVRMSNGS